MWYTIFLFKQAYYQRDYDILTLVIRSTSVVGFLGVIHKGRPHQRGEGGLSNAGATVNFCL